MPDEVDAWLKRSARSKRGSSVTQVIERIVWDAYLKRAPAKIPHWDAINPVFHVLTNNSIQSYLPVSYTAIANWRKHMDIPEPPNDLIDVGTRFKQRVQRVFYGQDDPVEFAHFIVSRRSS